MSIKLSRRTLLSLSTTAFALGLLGKRKISDTLFKNKVPGTVKGANFFRGHRLKLNNFPSPSKTYNRDVVIIGSGVSGLSCAYHLNKAGVKDIEIFELEDHIGGNSAGIEKEAPWGAHYLPLSNNDNHSLINFLKEADCIQHIDDNGIPAYNPYML